ncbi:unnamed protein product [Aphanomyces euteiches]|uniref:TRP C-terminal domain-containing protein n=1 Tax=Aphanomyces euteiches TaxID=100861 RepID=A0A6G0WQA2_9STRA|nr:hypothetical protein Ae201684_012843 [Aphanomyces euteiches]KAH9097757.1 hypothetical protein Ae201684P_001233 [Aphanomyces euteiches]KAH9145299.1 hypothetical protein AeRB84_010793 [Aphanomyces euteiches]
MSICATLFCFLGLVLSIFGVSLSSWSAGSQPQQQPQALQEASGPIQGANISAGPWGFCITGTNETGGVSKCFKFHSPTDSVVFVNSSTFAFRPAMTNLDRQSHGNQDLMAMATSESGPTFAETSCGRAGRGTLVLAVIAPVVAALATLLLLAQYCFTIATQRVTLGTSAFLILISFVCTVVALAMWAHGSPQNTSYGAGFVLEVLAAVSFFIALLSALWGMRRAAD